MELPGSAFHVFQPVYGQNRGSQFLEKWQIEKGIDQKAWVLFSSLTFAIVQYWQGFPLQGLSFHVDKVRVLD